MFKVKCVIKGFLNCIFMSIIFILDIRLRKEIRITVTVLRRCHIAPGNRLSCAVRVR